MKMKTKPKNGGRRPGAGRKPTGRSKRPVMLPIPIIEAAKAEAQKSETSAARVIERWIEVGIANEEKTEIFGVKCCQNTPMAKFEKV